jgi:hypothetical protein
VWQVSPVQATLTRRRLLNSSAAAAVQRVGRETRPEHDAPARWIARGDVCTSISSDFPAAFVALVEPNLGPTGRNPHIKFFEGRHRGYTLCEVTPERWRADFRIVDVLRDPDSAVRTAASWVIDAGMSGARPL